jgi:TonB family protein
MSGTSFSENLMFMVFALGLSLPGFSSSSARADGMRKIYDLPSVAYPEACMDKQVEGTVVLRFKVTPRGRIQDITVAKEVSACPQFTTAALSAVRHAHVYPLPPGVRLLKQSIEVPITFSMGRPET